MIEIYLKYDNMHTFGIINAFNCINNHVNSCINSMLSTVGESPSTKSMLTSSQGRVDTRSGV